MLPSPIFRVAAVAFAALMSGAGLAPAQSDSSPEQEIPWSSFRWASYTIGDTTLERAAMMVPFDADTLGGTYWLQLDTGADSNIWLYAGPVDDLLRRRGVERDTTRPFAISSGRLGAHELRDMTVTVSGFDERRVDPDDPLPKIGTLGLGFFSTAALLIDFSERRFATMYPASAIPDWIEENASWTTIDYRNGKLFLPLALAGVNYDDFFYDSGSSIFPLITTQAIWREATGRIGEEETNTVWTVPSFGERVTLVGAPISGDVTMGRATLEAPLIFHLREGPESMFIENWNYRVSGMIGNELFADRYLVIIDLPHGRFGVIDRTEDRDGPVDPDRP